MGYYAKINDNAQVEQVIVASPEVIATYPGTWVETFPEGPERYAGIGDGWTGAGFEPCPYDGAEWDGNAWTPSTEYKLAAANNYIRALEKELGQAGKEAALATMESAQVEMLEITEAAQNGKV